MRKAIYIFIISIILIPGVLHAYEKEIKTITSTLAESIAASGKKSIAVVDFTDLQGNVTELGRFLSEEFSVALSETGNKFEVVDRTQLKSILKEQHFTLSGLVDRKTVQKIGTIAGVQCLVTGTLTPFGDSIRLAVKVLDTSTAKVIGGSRGDIAKTKAIEELLIRGINVPSSTSFQPSAGFVVSSATNPKSKEIGNIVFTVRKIITSRAQIDVVFDIFNKSNDEYKLAINSSERPTIVDDKGNRFRYKGGIAENSPHFIESDKKRNMENAATTLLPKTNNNATLKFFTEERLQLRDFGSKFDLSINFMLYNRKDQSTTVHQISFSDIKK